MSFNDFPTDFRKNFWRNYLNPENDCEAAAGIFLQAADNNDDYDKPANKVLEEIVEFIGVDLVVDGNKVRFE